MDKYYYTLGVSPARRQRMAAVSARLIWVEPLKRWALSPSTMPARYHW